ncbi:MAG: DMT family transporter, partial [Patescibacteria group bacterium]|nr:DMT family transporter [Patescibacteria group bacterium]
MNIPILGPLLIVLASSLWAVDALIRTPLTQTIPSAAIVFYEHVFGVVILIPLFFKSFRVLKNLSVKTWLSIILLAFVSSVGGTVFFTQALSASFVTGDFITPLLLLKLQPIIVIGLSVMLLKEKISRQFYPFALIAIFGSYLMSFGTTIPSFHFSGKELVVLLSLAASFCWGLGTIISKTLLKQYSSQDATFLRFLAAIPVGFLVMILMNQFFPPSLLSSSDILRFIAIALSTGAVALLIYYAGLSRTHAHVST